MRKHMPERGEVTDHPLAAEAGAGSPPGGGPGVDYADLGEHVGSVLKAAEAAALAIRTQAEDEAARRVADAGREAGRILHEAEGLRAEAEEANRMIREGADAYAEKKRRDADGEVAELLRAAQETVERRTGEEEARQKALQEDVERTEQRLAELAAGLRELAGRLESLAAVESPEAHAEETPLDQSLLASIGQEGVRERDT